MLFSISAIASAAAASPCRDCIPATGVYDITLPGLQLSGARPAKYLHRSNLQSTDAKMQPDTFGVEHVYYVYSVPLMVSLMSGHSLSLSDRYSC